MRSRAVNLPMACCLSMRACPPPSAASTFSSAKRDEGPLSVTAMSSQRANFSTIKTTKTASTVSVKRTPWATRARS